MTETNETMRRHAFDCGIAPDAELAFIHDADRLARYERDLHDDIGKDRSQDTDWLRAGFLQRGAEIERLEDGIRALADEMHEHADPTDEILLNYSDRLRDLLGEGE
ncbi:hypothetical protein [Halofilum ochraceum]|uniref:hypothetical protein n=1 Tax=Halofilum ochraceum TaxID=1611323 RepID=UPI0008D9F3CE|nr:hypothetical protein [Halofilum ochraceum]